MKKHWKQFLALFLALAMVLVSGIVVTNRGFQASNHEHSDECYSEQEVSRTLTCTIPEGLDENPIICGQEEDYALSCGYDDGELIDYHSHTNACYNNGELACGQDEFYERHYHNDATCYSGHKHSDLLGCFGEKNHKHTDQCCYDIVTEKVLSCEYGDTPDTTDKDAQGIYNLTIIYKADVNGDGNPVEIGVPSVEYKIDSDGQIEGGAITTTPLDGYIIDAVNSGFDGEMNIVYSEDGSTATIKEYIVGANPISSDIVTEVILKKNEEPTTETPTEESKTVYNFRVIYKYVDPENGIEEEIPLNNGSYDFTRQINEDGTFVDGPFPTVSLDKISEDLGKEIVDYGWHHIYRWDDTQKICKTDIKLGGNLDFTDNGQYITINKYTTGNDGGKVIHDVALEITVGPMYDDWVQIKYQDKDGNTLKEDSEWLGLAKGKKPESVVKDDDKADIEKDEKTYEYKSFEVEDETGYHNVILIFGEKEINAPVQYTVNFVDEAGNPITGLSTIEREGENGQEVSASEEDKGVKGDDGIYVKTVGDRIYEYLPDDSTKAIILDKDGTNVITLVYKERITKLKLVVALRKDGDKYNGKDNYMMEDGLLFYNNAHYAHPFWEESVVIEDYFVDTAAITDTGLNVSADALIREVVKPELIAEIENRLTKKVLHNGGAPHGGEDYKVYVNGQQQDLDYGSGNYTLEFTNLNWHGNILHLDGVVNMKRSVTLTYDSNFPEGSTNNGVILDPETGLPEKSFTVKDPADKITVDGYTFGGWIDDEGNTYEPGKPITIDKDTTLHAIWIPDEKEAEKVDYTIIFRDEEGNEIKLPVIRRDEPGKEVGPTADDKITFTDPDTGKTYEYVGSSPETIILDPKGSNEIVLTFRELKEDEYTLTLRYWFDGGQLAAYPDKEFNLNPNGSLKGLHEEGGMLYNVIQTPEVPGFMYWNQLVSKVGSGEIAPAPAWNSPNEQLVLNSWDDTKKILITGVEREDGKDIDSNYVIDVQFVSKPVAGITNTNTITVKYQFNGQPSALYPDQTRDLSSVVPGTIDGSAIPVHGVDGFDLVNAYIVNPGSGNAIAVDTSNNTITGIDNITPDRDYVVVLEYASANTNDTPQTPVRPENNNPNTPVTPDNNTPQTPVTNNNTPQTPVTNNNTPQTPVTPNNNTPQTPVTNNNTPQTPVNNNNTPQTPVVDNAVQTSVNSAVNTPVDTGDAAAAQTPANDSAASTPAGDSAAATPAGDSAAATPAGDAATAAPAGDAAAAAPVADAALATVPGTTAVAVTDTTPLFTIADNGQGEISLQQIDDVETALADMDLGHICNILYFLILLATVVVLGFYFSSAKKHQARIFELREELGEDDPYKKDR